MSRTARNLTKRGGVSKTQSLTIYLIKQQITSLSDIVEETGADKHSLKISSELRGTLYTKTMPPHPPKWARIFEGAIEKEKLGLVATTAAVLIVRVKDRYFALTFGQGRHLLKTDCWEERFGLRVALNCIEEGKLRSLDKQTFDSMNRHSREQASVDSPIENFGLDLDQDLLRAVTGTPRDKSAHGNRMSGADSLHVSLPVALADLPRLLSVYLEKYEDLSYRDNFPWVDQISEVRETAAISQLDEELVRLINGSNLDRIWMAVPEVVDWSKVEGFLLGRSRECGVVSDIHLPQFLKTLNEEEVTLDLLKSRKIFSVDGEGTEINKWQAYRCIYAELAINGDTHLLSAGKWYRVTRDFVEEVNTFYKKIDRYTGALPIYTGKNEGEYNERTHEGDKNRFALMDQQCIQIGASKSKVEFCDLLSNKREIIHVKRYGASSVLSHLFSQGVNSGELFLMEEKFRKEVNKKLPQAHRIADIKRRPTPKEYQVVFAVISDSKGDLELPFFSKLNLKHAARRLSSWGYEVALAKIAVDERYAKTEDLSKRKAARRRMLKVITSNEDTAKAETIKRASNA